MFYLIYEYAMVQTSSQGIMFLLRSLWRGWNKALKQTEPNYFIILILVIFEYRKFSEVGTIKL